MVIRDWQSKGRGFESPRLQKVYGSPEELPLRDLLVALLGPEGRRRVQLRYLPNDKLFVMYQAELILHIRNEKNLKNIFNLLTHFKNFLGSYPPLGRTGQGFPGTIHHPKASHLV